jgi:hypothetical protein
MAMTQSGVIIEAEWQFRVTGSSSPMPTSWNQIASWLKQIDGLRQAA